MANRQLMNSAQNPSASSPQQTLSEIVESVRKRCADRKRPDPTVLTPWNTGAFPSSGPQVPPNATSLRWRNRKLDIGLHIAEYTWSEPPVRESPEALRAGCLDRGGIQYNIYITGIDDNVDELYIDEYSLWDPSISYNFRRIEVTQNAFSHATHLRTAVFDLYILNVQKHAFSQADNLQAVYFKHLGNIAEEAFANCKSLQMAELRAIWNVGQRCFFGCPQLRSVTLTGCSDMKIGNDCFLECPALQMLSIPEEVRYKKPRLGFRYKNQI